MATHMLVIDLEMTCCNDHSFSQEQMEIIEIGAVRVCCESYEPVSCFQCYVRPNIHPILSTFCRELLSITQARIDAALTFTDAWRLFLGWVNGVDSVCSWGRCDWTWMKRECKRNAQWFPFRRFFNLSKAFGRNKRLALKAHGLMQVGTRHCGLDDAKTYAQLLLAAKPNRTWN